MNDITYKNIKEGEIGKEANPIILEALKKGGRVIFKMKKGQLIIRVTEKPEIIKKIDELIAIDYQKKQNE